MPSSVVIKKIQTLLQRIYIRLAAESARLQPARSPLASNRLARAMVAENVDCKRFWACFKEAGVGCRSSCAATDCGAINPAFGFPADWRMAASNWAISSLQGPAWATGMLKQSIAQTIGAVVPRSFDIGARLPNCSTWRHQWPGHYSPNLTACTQVGTNSGNGNHDVAGSARITLERAPEGRRTY